MVFSYGVTIENALRYLRGELPPEKTDEIYLLTMRNPHFRQILKGLKLLVGDAGFDIDKDDVMEMTKSIKEEDLNRRKNIAELFYQMKEEYEQDMNFANSTLEGVALGLVEETLDESQSLKQTMKITCEKLEKNIEDMNEYERLKRENEVLRKENDWLKSTMNPPSFYHDLIPPIILKSIRKTKNRFK